VTKQRCPQDHWKRAAVESRGLRRVAIRVKNLGRPNWYRGTSVYRLMPPLMPDSSQNDFFVIVAVTPATVDHGQPETAVFAACRHCRGFEAAGELDWSTVDLLGDNKVVGDHDHAEALRRLQRNEAPDGYTIVESQDEFDAEAERWRQFSMRFYDGRDLFTKEEPD